MARGTGYRLSLNAADVQVGLNNEQLRILFVGADAKAESSGLDALPGKVNYFVGRDPKAWLHDIPTFGRVRYTNVYPGVDMVWYGKQGRLEYDLDLQPGADPNKIAMRFEGARKLTLEPNGDLRVEMASGSLSLKLPEVYQDGAKGRQRIVTTYDLRAGNEVGFQVALYDKTRPLVIDPVLVYATYFGSGSASNSASPEITGVAVDASGNIYIGGSVSAEYIPTVNPLQAAIAGFGSCFITKFDSTGQTILYSTYLGGSQEDNLQGIAVDADGSLIGTGTTYSVDFPAVNPLQPTFSPTGSAFAFKINPAGNGLTYSTALNGSFGYAVAVDTSHNAYFTGHSDSLPPPEAGLVYCCAFVEELSNTGGEVYAAPIGATVGYAIAVDTSGAAYVAGNSTYQSFPNNPPGAQKTNAGGTDAFVAKLSPETGAVAWATFLGGSSADSANAIALGSGSVVYVGGYTSSTDLPVTAGVVQTTYRGGTDAFVAQLSADGTAFNWVTYLGGGRSDTVASLAVAADGLIVAGNTSSQDFPTVNAIQPVFPGPPHGFLKSTNSGVSFSAAETGLPQISGGVILPDPSSPGTLLLDTPYPSNPGVFRSSDDGATWVSVQPYTTGAGSTARSLSNPSVLYSLSYSSLIKSTDGGQTWNTVLSNLSGPGKPQANMIGISPTDPNTVLLINYNSESRSTDGGRTYSYPIGLPFFLYNGGFDQIVASPDGSMYVASVIFGLYKSTDVGLTWNRLGGGVNLGYVDGFSLSPSDSSILYAADGHNVYRSADAGAAWSIVATGTALTNLAVDPSNPLRVYGSSSANDQVLVSTDGGATWTPTGGLLDSSAVRGLSVSPFNGAEVYLSNYVPSSGFITKLGSDGKTLTWSTYYGSYQSVGIGGAALAPAGDVWFAGSADSGSLSLTPNARNSNTNAYSPAFLARISDGTASCTYTLSPATQYSYSAGRLAFSVTAPSGCAWTATPSDSWIHLIRTSGTGSGTIPLAVDANTTASTRNGTVTVNSQIYTIVQPSSSCTYQVTSPALTSAGGTASITITAPTACPWDVELQNSDPAAVTSPSTGTGNGTVTVSVPPNPSNANSLSYGVQVGGASSSVYVDAATCAYSILTNSNLVFLSGDAQQYSNPISANCSWTAVTDQPGWLTLTNASSNGSGTLQYTVTLNNTGVDRVAHITAGTLQFTVTQAFTSQQFADVTANESFFDAANLMFLAGVTDGCVGSSDPSTRMFCPNDSVTREQMAAFIVRAVTGTLTPAVYNPVPLFTDVPTTNPFFPHIQKMEELGVTDGCATGQFCPSDTVPRYQMGIFTVRARLALYGANFSYNSNPYFADVPVDVEGGTTTFPFIQRAYEEHVTNGCGTNPLVYCPDELVTRGQMASFIMRALFNETTILDPTAPLLTGVSPNAMAATVGAQITVTITGINTSFQSGDTVTVPSGMLAVSNVVVNSATSITLTLTANPTVVAGPQALVVTSGGQNLTLPLAIKVGTY